MIKSTHDRFLHFVDSYQSYKVESDLFNYKPNNLFHFAFLYFFTETYAE